MGMEDNDESEVIILGSITTQEVILIGSLNDAAEPLLDSLNDGLPVRIHDKYHYETEMAIFIRWLARNRTQQLLTEIRNMI
jgi:hypothetical protein